MHITYSHGCKACSEGCSTSKLVNGAQRTPVAYCQLWKQVGIQAHQILHGKKETAVSTPLSAADKHQGWIESNDWDVGFDCKLALTPSTYPVVLLMCRASAAPCPCEVRRSSCSATLTLGNEAHTLLYCK